MEKITNQSSESIVIGGLINNMNWLLDFCSLKADYFNSEANKIIYNTLKLLYKKGSTSCDIIDIYAIIESTPKHLQTLNEVGGEEYISTLSELAFGKPLNDVETHVKVLIDCSYKNALYNYLIGLEKYLENNKTKSKRELAKIVEGELLSLNNQYGNGGKMELIGNRMDKIMDELDREANKEFSGFPTCHALLDKYITYEKGEMVVFSAPAKFGKSQWVVDVVYNLCIKQGVPIAVIDSELSDRFFIVRLISRITNLPFKFIKNGKYKDYEWAKDKVSRAEKTIRESALIHEYIVGWDRDEIKKELNRMKIQHNIQIVIWDYLKIDNIEENKQERLELAMLTNFLKNDIAGKLNVAMIALAQTSDYSGTDGLRIFGSNQIKQYCSTVCYMVRKNKEQIAQDFNELGGNMYIHIKENRNGKQMTDENKGVNFTFDSSKAHFVQSVYQHEDIVDMVKEENYEDDYIVNEDDNLDF